MWKDIAVSYIPSYMKFRCKTIESYGFCQIGFSFGVITFQIGVMVLL